MNKILAIKIYNNYFLFNINLFFVKKCLKFKFFL